jgi:hypothetical protein
MSEQTPETAAEPTEPAEPGSGEPEPEQDGDEEGEEASEEQDSDEGEPEPDDHDTPEAVAGLDDRELEKRFKRIETAHNTYSRKLSEIMGEDAQALEPCPRCAHGIPAFVFPFAPVSEQVRRNVLVSIGETPPAARKQDPYTETCATCDGEGVTLSGANTTRGKSITCVDCDGNGYTLVGDRRNKVAQAMHVTASAADSTVTVNGGDTPVEQPPDLDPWGRGPDHPDYGRLPMYAHAD